ncbi:hypothetical protein C9J03_25775 [Photobacterium gaetbulicola]|nr:hypothetical protein C9J03_25775 [Photobacterium gaetbulicola]
MILMLFLLIVFSKVLKLNRMKNSRDISVQRYELLGLNSPKAVQADRPLSFVGQIAAMIHDLGR